MKQSIQIEVHGRLVEVRVQGKLTREAYREFTPVIEETIERQGKIRILFVMSDFHGWTAEALWDDIKFDVKHFTDVERLAIVGEKRWQKGMAMFCKPFTTAKVRYFDREHEDEARRWLSAPSHAAT